MPCMTLLSQTSIKAMFHQGTDAPLLQQLGRRSEKAVAGLPVRLARHSAAGASETEELYHVLTACMMVRRLKKDVLSQLPPKRRTQVTPPATTMCMHVPASYEPL